MNKGRAGSGPGPEPAANPHRAEAGRRYPEIIAAVILEKDGKYLLAHETFKTSGRSCWIIPGCHVEFGERIEDAALREIEEETGIRAQIVKFVGFHEAVFARFGYHTVVFFYVGRAVGGVFDPELGRKEDATLRFFSPEELKGLDLVESAKWALGRLELI